jgi:hypothetical protein
MKAEIDVQPTQGVIRGQIPTLIIDSCFLRKHLHKGWAVLNCVAVVARQGRVNLCIPWLVEQEVLSGIEEQFDAVTGQQQFLTNVRQLAHLSEDPQAVGALCDDFDKLRVTICEQTKRRFRNWLETGQAERAQLAAHHTGHVFKAYFGGEAPFDRPKNRDHLPDAFIYQIASDLIDAGKQVWFLTEDAQLRSALERTGKVKTFASAQPVFAELEFQFDFKTVQQRSNAPLAIERLREQVADALKPELCNQVLRYRTKDASIEQRIHEVLEIRQLSIDRQSVVHIDDRSLLIAFEADILLRAAARVFDSRNLTERISEFQVSIQGHLLIEIVEGIEGEKLVKEIELDDFEVGAIEKTAGSETMQSIPPQPRVVDYYQAELNAIVSSSQVGFVVVVGSTLRNRRLVAEHIISMRKGIRENEMVLLSFHPVYEKHLPVFECTGEFSLSSFWSKAEDVEAGALGLSNEGADWALEGVNYLSKARCFIVATMKSLNSPSAVVRYLASLPHKEVNYLEELLAVAWIQDVTPETITFGISEHGQWGDGSWEDTLSRAESLMQKKS